MVLMQFVVPFADPFSLHHLGHNPTWVPGANGTSVSALWMVSRSCPLVSVLDPNACHFHSAAPA